MMNRRPGVTARFASGDELAYLQAIQAAASHTYLGGRESLILVRRDVATRSDLFHEWLHRHIQVKQGHSIPDEERLIESFLRRFGRLLGID